ncbi:hypothetical protein L1987_88372 [Smallanthus sonchifolius]|nr:hypothetical protein L1987_88390 [Smallanthus sonchifolius]KAI3668614.1 hypothetical protein L1987_88372 [Smallanthus sonchifolius]
MLFPIIFKLFAYVMGEVPADVFEDIQKDVRDMEGCFGFDLRWVHARLGAVAKARFDTHHLEEYAQTSAALEKATSALAQLEGELSRPESSALMELSVSINLMEYLLHKENCINQWHEGVESGTERLSKPKQRHSFSSCKDDSC